MSECSTLWPVQKCGLMGSCVFENGTSFCKCNAKWSQNLEWNYFVEENSLSSGICNYNLGVVSGIYTAISVSAILSFTLDLYNTNSRKQLKKRVGWFLFCALVTSFSLYRVFDPNALFGVDFCFSFLISIALPLSQLQGYIHLQKYSYYISNKVSYFFDTGNFYQRLEKARTAWFYANVLCGSCYQLLWISTTVERKTALLLIRIAFAIESIGSLAALAFTYVLFGEIFNDMERIISVDNSLRPVNHATLFRSMEKKIPRIKRTRRQLVVGYAVIFILHFGAVIWDFWYVCIF
uniref:Uncharacterized protein n=1 Tax=Aplanochytrium stocchinoi TaxID=215587 RepID=A0A7S3PG22_9STRA